MTKHYIIPIFVPHFGCPHDCIFCNQKKITGLQTDVTAENVRGIIEEYLSYFKKEAFIEAAFYGGSFTAIDIETQKELLNVPLEYKKRGLINEIRLSTRPDSINQENLHVLKEYGVDTIELGVQSLDEDVLKASDRGHSSEDVYKAVDLIKKNGLGLGLQMMTGLPKDTFIKSLKTCIEIVKCNPDCVRIYPTLVIKDTYLEKLYLEGEYMPMALEEAVELCSLLLMIYNLNGINVIRVGLQPTEDIQLGKDVVSGPFHPAFRQLVESHIYRVIIDSYIKTGRISTDTEELEIKANRKIISSISGQHSSNINHWKREFGFRNVKIYEDDVDLRHIFITIGKFYDKLNMDSLMERYLTSHPLIKTVGGFRF